jgi:Holliday junction resolvase-like predicted endonuclease
MTLVFVEVRTRRSNVRGLAEESVTLTKQRRLATLAYAYLQHLDDQGTPWPNPWRIDVLALQMDGSGTARVHHLQNVIEDVC